jgi:site-specific DNA recombinase
MWMGGVPPLGYTIRDRKLVVIPGEAETVRHIFHRYAALGSVRLLKEELDAQGTMGKSWISRSGQNRGGKPIGRGALYLILQNRIYRGEIVHKNETYPGEHQPIIDPVLWDAVQARLAANAVERGAGIRVKNPSLLTGLLFDSEGQRMTPTHAVKQGRRYRYYVSRPLIVGTRAKAVAALRIPAPEIEQIVTNRIKQLLSQPASVFAILETEVSEPMLQQKLMACAANLAGQFDQMSPLRMRVLLLALVQRVDVRADEVIIHLRPRRLAALLGNRCPASNPAGDEEPTLPLSHPVRLRRAGKEVRMVIDHTDPFAPPAKADRALIRVLVRAHRFHEMLVKHKGGKFGDLAKSENLHRSYFSGLLRLAYLAPDITTAILDGHQPAGLTATQLIERADLPMSWREQRRTLGFI